MEKWARSNYQPNLPLKESGRVTACREHIELSRYAAEEGMVLLKNESKLLPLSPGVRVCLFGKATFDYVKGGGGSGDVHCPYVRNLYDGLALLEEADIFEPLASFYRENVTAQYASGALPGMTVEPILPDALLRDARSFSDTAILSISRFSGEGWDRSDVDYREPDFPAQLEKSMPELAGEVFPQGDFYLTDRESALVEQVCAAFPKVIVLLNIGGVMDTRWIRRDSRIGAAVLTWQGGMEGGLAAANILFGHATPSGKLPDTFAGRLEDYPSSQGFHDSPHFVEYTEDIYVGYRYFETIPGARDSVCYPFGYGLSYTEFSWDLPKVTVEDEDITIQTDLHNIGSRPGKEVLQFYVRPPQGALGKPTYTLAGFLKSAELQPGESQEITIRCPLYVLASYDDTGAVEKNAYVLEKGEYRFYLGSGLHNLQELTDPWVLEENRVLFRHCGRLEPTSLPRRLRSDGSYEDLLLSPAHDPDECAFEKMGGWESEGVEPACVGYPQRYRHDRQNGAVTLADVHAGKSDLETLLAQFTDDQLIHLLGGQPNTGVANTYGLGNLPAFGIPNIMTADGPAGVRIEPETGIRTTAFPCGTLLAATWNPEVVSRVGAAGGAELKENNLAVWLTPAVNIHRNPYCGRNFEYYSEDPLLVGTIGAAMVQGIQSNHVAACVKHFAANNKEINRKNSDSRISQRALREIYLKGFEFIVKNADPWSIMTSYNIINGHRASESHELLEDILRGEWGFRGTVVTDWWNRGEQYKEILAGNDVKMGSGYPHRVRKALDMGLLTRDDLLRSARRVLELILKID